MEGVLTNSAQPVVAVCSAATERESAMVGSATFPADVTVIGTPAGE